MDMQTLDASFKDLKERSTIFDINCYLSYYYDKPDILEDVITPPEQFLEEGINKLVLANKRGVTNQSYEYSNNELFERVATNDAFYAAPVVVPEMNLAGRTFAHTLDGMIAKKAVILRMFPMHYRHSMKKWQIGDMLKIMEERKIPLMLWHTQISWDDVAEIAESYPNLPIIIEGSDQKTIYYVRYVMGLCEKYKNIYLEMHNFSQYGFLPYALEHLGYERLLFGSFSPYNDMNGVLHMIFNHTNAEQREGILSKNFEKLVSDIVR